MRTLLRGLALAGLVFVIVFGGMSLALYLFSGTHYTKNDAATHYERRAKAIQALRAWFASRAPRNRYLYLEMKGNRQLATVLINNPSIPDSVLPYLRNRHWEHNDATFRADSLGKEWQGWDMNRSLPVVDSLLHAWGWTQATLDTLNEHLDEAGCISVSNGDPADIGYQRSGLGMFYFWVHSRPLPEALRRRYQECSLARLNDTVMLRYEGGPMEDDCMP